MSVHSCLWGLSAALVLCAGSARAQEAAESQPAPSDDEIIEGFEAEPAPDMDVVEEDSNDAALDDVDEIYGDDDDAGEEGVDIDQDVGYTPPPSQPDVPAFVINGYIDLGFAHATGDGTSWRDNDTRLPLDYGADTFATAVNSRGDVASTDSDGRFVNGFLPRSVGAGGQPTFLVNTVNVDLLFRAPTAPVLVFARLQMLPRFNDEGDETRFYIEQAFGRVQPFSSQSFFLFVGKFDSVMGIEYLENQATLRTGVTPSLIARYTTGTVLGAKGLYQLQIPALQSAFQINASVTNGPSFVDALQGQDVNLTGAPTLAARAGWDLNLPSLQLKLGGSFSWGPRNDQSDEDARQTAWGVDARLTGYGFQLRGEFFRLDQDAGPLAGKRTGLGNFPIASAFEVEGFYAQLSYQLPWSWGALNSSTLYLRYGQREAEFDGFTPITVSRLTAGARFDIWRHVILKLEYLINDERDGAPEVDNDVQTASLVFWW